ncbi:phage protease [Pseudomonas sp. AU11447]|uniref:phage protease n=1 Tax=Pseudomonas sp. AU11447 TaxID=1843184 RepID=UPI0009F1DBBE|nr:phage protease [Pseudomonas sp. AU11447]
MKSIDFRGYTAFCFELGETAPEWVEVLPPGPTVLGRDGRSWTCDPRQVIASTLAHGVDLPFDYMHATEIKAQNGEEAPAAGWVKEYRVNHRGAIETRVEWTPRARSLIASREYRFVSPVFLYDNSGRIQRFSSFGLVNKPNLAIKAINFESAKSYEGLSPEEQEVARLFGMTDHEYIELISWSN